MIPFGTAYLNIAGQLRVPLQPGVNTITVEAPLDIAGTPDGLSCLLQVERGGSGGWASMEITQLELYAHAAGNDVATVPLAMTALIPSEGNGGGGGCRIVKTGILASITTVELLGYYLMDFSGYASALEGQAEIYAPRWESMADYTPVSPAAAIPLLSGGPDWGWMSGDAFAANLPEGAVTLAKVSLDGGAPVFALLRNDPGY